MLACRSRASAWVRANLCGGRRGGETNDLSLDIPLCERHERERERVRRDSKIRKERASKG
eukprot:693941-Amorphochlora_amoeboformis.AAC.2